MAPEKEERRQVRPLHPEDRDRLIRIEMLCSANADLIKDHEERLRKVEPRLTRQFGSLSGLWLLATTTAAFFGMSLK